ncbi:hypothetical protein [Actinoallomurus sp. NPDC052274]|uniref:hypothetical protein n=1 Tax=Actinoallomurus sp. NPDC052274 TaxID=3155420 RepID=UPI00343E9F85
MGANSEALKERLEGGVISAAWSAETRARAFLGAGREMLGWFTWVPSDWTGLPAG